MVDTSSEIGASPVADGGAAQYQSLYRRFRPQRFSEVRGQDLVSTTLRNAVRDGRIVHAYLFSGPRGTGKTSTARILAKALNCTDLRDGEPCGECESCVEIARGASLDVHELDAASNNGVDAMRDLVARASLSTPGKRKVYIIDEVHMLSTAASNALLKTLEEPPEHVVFVLATTDPQKVLPTIRSRTQHFEFHLLEQPVLESLLHDVATAAGLDLPEEGIDAAVRRGHGSARDALSMLDQVAASGVVEDDGRHLSALVAAIASDDAPGALRTVGDAVAAGFDAQRLAVELVEALREQFLASVARHSVHPEPELLGPDGRALLSPARAVRSLELIGRALVDMRDALDPRTTLEVALVRLTSPEVDESASGLLDRIERLERRLAEYEQAGPPSAPGPRTAPSRAVSPPTEADPPPPLPGPSGPPARKPALGAFRGGEAGPAHARTAPPPPVAAPPAEPATVAAGGAVPSRDDLVQAWADVILGMLKPRARAIYRVGRWLAVADGTAVFALPNAAHVEHASAIADEVSAAISAHFGARVGLRCVVDDAPGGTGGASDGDAAAATGPSDPEAGSSDEAELMAEVELQPGEAAAPTDTASWAEHRVREVFPGVEEVTR